MVLITGGAGFIGSHVARALVAKGTAVRVLDDLSTGDAANIAGLDVELVEGDLADPAVLDRALDGVDAVVNLAARVSVPESCEDPIDYDRVNGHAFVQLLQACRERGVRRVVYASSAAIYGDSPPLPTPESAPLAPRSPYAAQKAANEHYGRAFSETLGLETVGLRFFNVFGPRQDPGGAYAGVVAKFCERAAAGRGLTIFGDGEQRRDFVYVEDVARAVVLALSAPDVAGRAFNIGGGGVTTINQLARAVVEASGAPLEVVHGPPRLGDVRDSAADISLADECLGWRPTADLTEALAATLRWYRSHVTD